jgi:hypothetical protein
MKTGGKLIINEKRRNHVRAFDKGNLFKQGIQL